MIARLKLAGQIAAVGLVTALFALLVWKIARDDDPGGAAAAFQRGEKVAAPQFALSRLEGEGKLRLASLRGKIVVINFWAAWCDPCRKEAPLFEAAWQRYRARGVEFIGVNTQDYSGAARDFVGQYEVTYPNVRDQNGRVLADYGGLPLPRTFFVGRSGLVIGHIYGEASAEDLERGIQSALST